jgi:hypothetical protein
MNIQDDEDSEMNIYFNQLDKKTFGAFDCLSKKDSYNMPDRVYEALQKIGMLNGVTIHHVRKKRDDFKQVYELIQHARGVYCRLREKLDIILPLVYSNLIKSGQVVEDFKLKFCVDGTQVGNNKNFLNFNFSILNEKSKCKTAFGHYILGIFSIDKEDYETLNECLSLIFDEIEEMKEIEIEDKTIKIEKYLGGDLKSLLNLAGVNAANSTYGCLWCKCPNNLYHDTTQEWSITDIEKGARTHDEADEKIGTKGYKFPAISLLFPFFRHLIDLLHLRLRITDKLNEYLFEKIYENSDDDEEYIDPIDLRIKDPVVGRINGFLVNECKLLKPIIFGTNTSKYKYMIRNLKGVDQIRLYEKLTETDQNNVEINSLTRLVPEVPECQDIQTLYKEFYSIYKSLKLNSNDVDELKVRTSGWLNIFTRVFIQKKVTPYMHAFAHHLHQFVALYPNLNDYNQEGHEKFNDIETTFYFKSTNKKETTLDQIIEKFNRLELVNLGFVL